MPHAGIRAHKTQAVQAGILHAALRLFTERGYFNTSVHDIRQTANVSTGSIYHHFKNKEAIAKALFDSLLQHLAATFEAIRAEHATTHDRCRAAVAFLFEFTEQDPDAMQFMLYARHREFMPEQPPVCSSRPFEMLKQMVAEGMEAGEVRRMDTLTAAAALFGGPVRMIHLRLDGVQTRPLPEILDEAWDCAWRSVAN